MAMAEKMATINVPYNWKPRPDQWPLWKYLQDGGMRAVAVNHRRQGKDTVGLRHISRSAFKRVGNYWFMLPEYSQARKSVWDAINPHTGIKILDEVFPYSIREDTRQNDMFIRFRGDSTFQLVGSDNFNSLLGSPPIGLVNNEYSIADPRAWGYLSPILEENGG